MNSTRHLEDNGRFRTGFDQEFLITPTPTPSPLEAIVSDLLVVDNSAVIPYTHFSLTMSRSRRLCRWAAWNIDGGRLLSLGRTGHRFREDARIPTEYQTLESAYRHRRIDRGHVARRADLVWGVLAEAEAANADSFLFPNIVPQVDAFNQASKGGVWGRLENAVLANGRLHQRKLNVIAGPVLRREDRVVSGVKVPREFWKVLAYALDDRPRIKAFVLSQSLVGIEAHREDFTEFATYEVGLRELEDRISFTFDDALHNQETDRPSLDLEARPPVSSVTEVDW